MVKFCFCLNGLILPERISQETIFFKKKLFLSTQQSKSVKDDYELYMVKFLQIKIWLERLLRRVWNTISLERLDQEEWSKRLSNLTQLPQF